MQSPLLSLSANGKQLNPSLRTTTIQWLKRYHTPAPSVVGVASADSTLINGKGRSVGGPLVDLTVLRVEQGRSYRFRLVSISCDSNYIFSIDGHQLTVIEVDGENVLPYTVDQIQIFTGKLIFHWSMFVAWTCFIGQRYSFILNATQPVDNYWVRALPNNGLNGLARGFTDGSNSAILRYEGATDADPTTSQPTNPTLLDESQLVPFEDPAAPGPPTLGEADVSINLALSFNRTNSRFYINGTSFEPPSVPILLQLLSGARNAQDILPAGSIYTLPPNKVVEVSIPAGIVGGPVSTASCIWRNLPDPSSQHPFHLHGVLVFYPSFPIANRGLLAASL
jgi:iron transport multicopper oxidase